MTAYFVYCSTGCTCCASENHTRGPFSSEEIAKKKAEYYKSVPILASQYASKGRYHIEGPCDVEQLPDGRLIIRDVVFDGFKDEITEDRVDMLGF